MFTKHMLLGVTKKESRVGKNEYDIYNNTNQNNVAISRNFEIAHLGLLEALSDVKLINLKQFGLLVANNGGNSDVLHFSKSFEESGIIEGAVKVKRLVKICCKEL